MKTLFFGIVLILLLGLGGFFYRNVTERTPVPEVVACTMDAKVCPDGTSVGRVGPLCEFAPCALPNIEIPAAAIAFVLPAGYAPVLPEHLSGELVGGFVKMTEGGAPLHTINVYRYPIKEGETADEIILAHTRYQPADMQAEDFERFSSVLVNGKEYRSTVIERFEALVHSAYYLVRTNDVLLFEVIEHDVVDWMEPDLVVGDLPEHKALLDLLSTLQSE